LVFLFCFFAFIMEEEDSSALNKRRSAEQFSSAPSAEEPTTSSPDKQTTQVEVHALTEEMGTATDDQHLSDDACTESQRSTADGNEEVSKAAPAEEDVVDTEESTETRVQPTRSAKRAHSTVSHASVLESGSNRSRTKKKKSQHTGKKKQRKKQKPSSSKKQKQKSSSSSSSTSTRGSSKTKKRDSSKRQKKRKHASSSSSSFSPSSSPHTHTRTHAHTSSGSSLRGWVSLSASASSLLYSSSSAAYSQRPSIALTTPLLRCLIARRLLCSPPSPPLAAAVSLSPPSSSAVLSVAATHTCDSITAMHTGGTQQHATQQMDSHPKRDQHTAEEGLTTSQPHQQQEEEEQKQKNTRKERTAMSNQDACALPLALAKPQVVSGAIAILANSTHNSGSAPPAQSEVEEAKAEERRLRVSLSQLEQQKRTIFSLLKQVLGQEDRERQLRHLADHPSDLVYVLHRVWLFVYLCVAVCVCVCGCLWLFVLRLFVRLYICSSLFVCFSLSLYSLFLLLLLLPLLLLLCMMFSLSPTSVFSPMCLSIYLVNACAFFFRCSHQ
jgi:hypothetical protein